LLNAQANILVIHSWCDHIVAAYHNICTSCTHTTQMNNFFYFLSTADIRMGKYQVSNHQVTRLHFRLCIWKKQILQGHMLMFGLMGLNLQCRCGEFFSSPILLECF